MTSQIPQWAMRIATPEDLNIVREAHGRGTLQIEWPNDNAVRAWAKQQAWPNPWFGFEKAFLTHMLENQANFALALQQSGLQLHLLRKEYLLSNEKIEAFDALYAARSEDGRPTSWGTLVEELREIRRAIEAGVQIQLEDGSQLSSWQDFYSWAHGRYHMLEDGYDEWIGHN